MSSTFKETPWVHSRALCWPLVASPTFTFSYDLHVLRTITYWTVFIATNSDLDWGILFGWKCHCRLCMAVLEHAVSLTSKLPYLENQIMLPFPAISNFRQENAWKISNSEHLLYHTIAEEIIKRIHPWWCWRRRWLLRIKERRPHRCEQRRWAKEDSVMKLPNSASLENGKLSLLQSDGRTSRLRQNIHKFWLNLPPSIGSEKQNQS